jgi:hypothetical protein
MHQFQFPGSARSIRQVLMILGMWQPWSTSTREYQSFWLLTSMPKPCTSNQVYGVIILIDGPSVSSQNRGYIQLGSYQTGTSCRSRRLPKESQSPTRRLHALPSLFLPHLRLMVAENANLTRPNNTQKIVHQLRVQISIATPYYSMHCKSSGTESAWCG